MTFSNDAEDAVKRAIGEFGKLDILINNAGISLRGPIDELDYDQFKQVR